MVVLFIIVIAGFIAHKCKLMGGDFDRKLSNFVIQVTCPCLIISSTMGDTMPDRSLILPLLVVGSLTYVFLIVVASFLPRIMPVKKEERGMYSFMIAYANVGFIGYPIITAIFGSSAVFYACILNVPNTLTIFIWGVLFVTGARQVQLEVALLASHARHLYQHYHRGLRLEGTRLHQSAVFPVGQHDRPVCPTRHRFEHCRHTHPAHDGQCGHLHSLRHPAVCRSRERALPGTIGRSRPHCGRHQRRTGGHARSIVRHHVLPEIRQGRDRHVARHVLVHSTFGDQHSPACPHSLKVGASSAKRQVRRATAVCRERHL